MSSRKRWFRHEVGKKIRSVKNCKTPERKN
jgi:hypothetical protein